jgi:hypothetical protein
MEHDRERRDLQPRHSTAGNNRPRAAVARWSAIIHGLGETGDETLAAGGNATNAIATLLDHRSSR